MILKYQWMKTLSLSPFSNTTHTHTGWCGLLRKNLEVGIGKGQARVLCLLGGSQCHGELRSILTQW